MGENQIPTSVERNQKQKIDEMIDNIKKLKADVDEMREAFDDIKKAMKSIENLLINIENGTKN